LYLVHEWRNLRNDLVYRHGGTKVETETADLLPSCALHIAMKKKKDQWKEEAKDHFIADLKAQGRGDWIVSDSDVDGLRSFSHPLAPSVPDRRT